MSIMKLLFWLIVIVALGNFAAIKGHGAEHNEAVLGNFQSNFKIEKIERNIGNVWVIFSKNAVNDSHKHNGVNASLSCVATHVDRFRKCIWFNFNPYILCKTIVRKERVPNGYIEIDFAIFESSFGFSEGNVFTQEVNFHVKPNIQRWRMSNIPDRRFGDDNRAIFLNDRPWLKADVFEHQPSSFISNHRISGKFVGFAGEARHFNSSIGAVLIGLQGCLEQVHSQNTYASSDQPKRRHNPLGKRVTSELIGILFVWLLLGYGGFFLAGEYSYRNPAGREPFYALFIAIAWSVVLSVSCFMWAF